LLLQGGRIKIVPPSVQFLIPHTLSSEKMCVFLFFSAKLLLPHLYIVSKERKRVVVVAEEENIENRQDVAVVN
jgi:hypothetical protein